MTHRPYRLGQRAHDAAMTRRRILEAAWSEIERAGYRPASIEAIADRAGVARITVYRHFATRGELLEAVAWEQLGRAQLERLDRARAHPDVVEATRLFLLENCLLFDDIGAALRAMIDVERDEPEIAAVLRATYRGRRLDSIGELAQRIAESGQVAPGWRIDDVADALAVLTGIEAFEVAMSSSSRSASDAAGLLFAMARGFFIGAKRRE